MFKNGGGLNRMLKEKKARLYIIRRCVFMLLCHRESTND
ncbi:hypothetical protein GQ55_5G195700 [Panicum hallii var. hallii]|uniref:Uncharacterized protein n=1 Tax=Panicum hallii var. hallii TaxID=1504633 RepID=A0A2T7DI25_9POAL|nr:hypothetical protein GQ55_5G195700 [Panicum hallii var. hallii]